MRTNRAAPSESVFASASVSRWEVLEAGAGTLSALSMGMEIIDTSSRERRRSARGARRSAVSGANGSTFVGISGYDYKPWRGRFYPDELPARRWLEYASRRFNSIELNGTFYSLKSPAVFGRWANEVPERDFVFAIKGGRFITHNLKLRRAETALGNFFASGVLAMSAWYVRVSAASLRDTAPRRQAR